MQSGDGTPSRGLSSLQRLAAARLGVEEGDLEPQFYEKTENGAFEQITSLYNDLKAELTKELMLELCDEVRAIKREGIKQAEADLIGDPGLQKYVVNRRRGVYEQFLQHLNTEKRFLELRMNREVFIEKRLAERNKAQDRLEKQALVMELRKQRKATRQAVRADPEEKNQRVLEKINQEHTRAEKMKLELIQERQERAREYLLKRKEQIEGIAERKAREEAEEAQKTEEWARFQSRAKSPQVHFESPFYPAQYVREKETVEAKRRREELNRAVRENRERLEEARELELQQVSQKLKNQQERLKPGSAAGAVPHKELDERLQKNIEQIYQRQRNAAFLKEIKQQEQEQKVQKLMAAKTQFEQERFRSVRTAVELKQMKAIKTKMEAELQQRLFKKEAFVRKEQHTEELLSVAQKVSPELQKIDQIRSELKNQSPRTRAFRATQQDLHEAFSKLASALKGGDEDAAI